MGDLMRAVFEHEPSDEDKERFRNANEKRKKAEKAAFKRLQKVEFEFHYLGDIPVMPKKKRKKSK